MTAFSRKTAAIVAAATLSAFMALPVIAQSADQDVVGTIVRFSTDAGSVDVTIGEDNPTVRDLLSRLPLTITVEEYAGREKISYFDPASIPPERPDRTRSMAT